MHIENVEQPGDEWDEFAETRPGVVLGHAARWIPTLQDAYGLAAFGLVARVEPRGAIQGVLPLVAFRSRPLGRPRLISLPFLDAAGPLCESPDVEAALLDAARRHAAAIGARGIEMRRLLAPAPPSGTAADAEVELGDATDRVNLSMALEKDAEAQWAALRAKVRNQCRKAEREGLAIAPGTALELLDAFYAPFCINMRDLGSPVHARSFFEAAARHFGPRMRIIVTRLEERPVGGLVALHYGDRVTIPWASTLRAERKRCPNNQIYWEAIRWATERGAARLDFGRSPRDAGTWRFKKGWGAEEETLLWQAYDAAADRGAAAETVQATASPLLQRVSALWSRLPVGVANAVGPRIRRYFAN